MPTLIKVSAIIIFIAVFIFIFLKVAPQIASSITARIIGSLAGEESGSSLTAKETDNQPCILPKTKRQFNSNPYYSGPLIDSHLHLPTTASIVSSVAKQNGLELPLMEGDLAAGKLVCLFDSEGIIKTFGFHITSKFAEGAGVRAAKEIEKSYPGKIAHFIMPPPVKSLNVDPSGIESILNGNQGLFSGFGEVALYMDGYGGLRPDDPSLKEIYKLAEEHNLVVMVHPEDNLKDGIEEVLWEFPKVNFFFHGGRNQEWVIELMDRYQNFYYSIDGDLLNLYGHDGGQQFKISNAKTEYLIYMRENFQENLEEVVSWWKARIERHPDRFTWGTDRWYGWHFDPEVGALIEEFSRSFIGRLDPTIQEKFAYKNAQRMLEKNGED